VYLLTIGGMGLSGTHGYNIDTRVLIDVLCFLFSCILVLFNSIYGIILRVLFCRLFSVVNSKTLQIFHSLKNPTSTFPQNSFPCKNTNLYKLHTLKLQGCLI